MRALFIHQNFPGQFKHVAQSLLQGGDQVVAICDSKNTQKRIVPTVQYQIDARLMGKPPPLAASFVEHVVRGRAAADVMLKLRHEGFIPDIVVGHVGWGECLAVRDVWPTTKLVLHAEFYYAADGANIGFDPEFQSALSFNERYAVRLKNAPILLAMTDADAGVAPTAWQRDRYPAHLQSKIHVLHEGIDTNVAAPNPAAAFTLPSGQSLSMRDEVITFVNRNLEPYRGYHIFMRSLPAILAERTNAHAVIVGGDGASYGPPPRNGQSWKDVFFNEVKDRLPLDRVHFVGKVPYASFISLMQISSAHVYLTYPFVLSWSMIEAMSAGALVIASKTAPVEEVIEDDENGLLTNFFDTEGLSERVIEALADPLQFSRIREAARRSIVDRYDLNQRCLPQWVKFLRQFDPANHG
ncbi:glycosyltransferase [Bradyrhizobium sp. JYMT SZCCT0428]|uniref:glycosyltransferase n=1 Tax=Bradyrhizobium sp. JYMT SZCCT0428 TaxID=2807673 RepID=UPI001BAB3929|nr:glycosyltransferase [Bradyrhizobium sp. JYMT SZCCT0428]MBR1153692.1 glycosyltransferase [Bradyrhizobium sp. JYMT SZCCT0428]